MLLEISRDIKKLNKAFDSIDEKELKIILIEIEDKIINTINKKRFLPVGDLVKDLLKQVRMLKNDLESYDKIKLQVKIKNMKDQIGEIIDQQMFCEIGGAGIYLKNMKEAEEK